MKSLILIMTAVTSQFLYAEPPSPNDVIRLGAMPSAQMHDPKIMSNLDTYDCKYINNLDQQKPQNPTLFKVPGCKGLSSDVKGVCRGIIRCAKATSATFYLHSECVTKSETNCPSEHECMHTSYYDSAGISMVTIPSNPESNSDQIFQRGNAGAEK